MVNCKGQYDIVSLSDSILRLNQAIRYVAILDTSNTVIECKGQGTSSLPLPPETLAHFVAIGPLLVLGAFSHNLESSWGRLTYTTGRFEKALVIIYKLCTHEILLVMDPIVNAQQLDEIATTLKKMEENADA